MRLNWQDKLKKGLLAIVFVLSLGAYAQTSEMELRYNALSARFEGRDKLLARDLKNYLQAYPYTTFTDEVNFMQGVLQVEKGHYKQGLKILESIDINALGRSHKTDYSFYRGYAYLMLQEYQRAAVYFALLKNENNRYTTRGTYYYAYCMYKLEQYDKALPELEKLENHTAYASTVPYYIVQIYYSQQRYEEVETLANTLLREQPDSPNRTELHRMLGEIYYLRSDYTSAAEHLGQYAQETAAAKEEPVRENMYMLGAAHYKNGAYSEAVSALKKVKQVRDSLSEATCLMMGNAYVQMHQPEQAKLSYQAAANYAITPAITEEASYNYVLCTYESSSALGESVKAFNDFLHQFPHSKYESSVYRLLGDALMRSKNYEAAISTLDAIRTPSAEMLQTKQYLRYQLSADCFLQGKMQQSIQWADAVIAHATESDLYTTEAFYLRAEANYRLRNFEACENDLARFFARADAKQSANRTVARYTQGYAFFAQGKYEKAKSAFSEYIDQASVTDPMYADALNRIGDCYFNARQFPQAITYYSQVSKLEASGADYALFQRGYALGLQHKYADKISVLRELINRYPKSDYADDGVYEVARAQLQQNDERGAITTYETLLASYPHSTYARKASLERAMLYRNLQQNEQAIAAYKSTIEKYPATEEAYTALDALEALYVESGNVNEYVEFTKKLARLNMNVSTKEDSLLYAAAELQYMQAAYQKASVSLTNYITKYCAGGRYCTTARYYLADSYYRLGKTTEALAEYKVLAETPANPYQEEAATRVAEISFDKADYEGALEAFYQMYSLASSHEKVEVARLGILRCSQALARYQTVIDISDQIVNDSRISEETKKEALYGRAKAYIALGQWAEAQPSLEILAKEVRTMQGAEAKYLLAQSYFEQQDLDAAEAQVMEFTQMNTQQQYWLARALILLSDINRERQELFQARQYLLVLQQNYNHSDDIQDLVSMRLAQLDQLENPIIKEETNDEE